MEVCDTCRGAARPIKVRRAFQQPFSVNTIRDAIRWPFHREGLLTALASGAVLWLLTKAGALAAIFACGVVLAVLFHITTSTAKGEDEFRSAGDFRGFFEDVVGPYFRASLAAVWSWGPIVAYVFWRRAVFFKDGDLQNPAGPEALVLLLLLFGGTFLFPMSLLAGALGTPMLQLLNPVVVIGYAVRLGRDYALLSVFCFAISLTESFTLGTLLFIDEKIIGLPNVVIYTVLLLPAMMMFRAMGMLVRARGDELGYGGADTYLVPVLGDRRPDRQLLTAEQEAQLKLQAAIDAEEQRPRTEAEHEQHRRAIEAASAGAARLQDLSIPSDDGLPPALQLARHVTGNDPDGAVEVLQRAGADVPATTLSAQGWVELGRACAERKHGTLALLALKRAVEVAPEGPLAPQAWLQAARVCDEQLKDRAQSNQLLGELLKRHPGTAEAAFAAKRLR